MVPLELKLATLKHVLFKINLYEKMIHDKDYKKLDTLKYRNTLQGLRNPIEFEINQIEEALKTEGIEDPRSDFSFKEIESFLRDETDIESLIDELRRIGVEIFRESESLGIEIVGIFDVPPEWIFPTSTANPIDDLAVLKAFEENDHLSVDNLFIDILMTDQRVEKTFEIWKTKPKISKRIPLLEEAIGAHIENRFYLSISTLIPQVEGLLRDALTSMGRKDGFDSMRKEDVRRATLALKELWQSKIHDLPEATSLLNSLPDVVSDLYNEFNSTEFVRGKLYRHGVCHGLQTDFSSRKNSLRLILLLDRMIFFYGMD